MRDVVRIVAAVVFPVVCQGATAATWYVDDSVAVSGDGTSWETGFKTIQEGIDAAADRDAVIVAEGTYLENITFRGACITLTSTDPLDTSVVTNTIIDADKKGSVVAFAGTEDETCVLTGFTLRNGSAYFGGGICGYGTRATIRNNTISGNAAWEGAGLHQCGGTVSNSTITGNFAGGSSHGGGGMFCEGISATITNCIISNFAYFDGGSIYCRNSSLTITNCTIGGTSDESVGGGIACFEGSSLTITGCTFTGNRALGGMGAGIFLSDSSAAITGCSFTDSVYEAIWCDASRLTLDRCTITSADSAAIVSQNGSTLNIINCAIYGNGYGGVCCGSGTAQITNCTVTANGGPGGIYCWYASLTVRNCIVWGNPGGKVTVEKGLATSITYSDIQGGFEGMGNIDADPLFVSIGHREDSGTPFDPSDDVWVGADLHLRPGSPCVDAGDNAAVPREAVADLEGNRRIANRIVDMGAYEYPSCLILYVDGKVPRSGDGLSCEAAFKTIQEGIDAASGCDIIVVFEGIYLENINFKGKSIVLRSTDPACWYAIEHTVIDGNQLGPAVLFAGSETEQSMLSGFTIRNGNGGSGGGVSGNGTHATIQNNIIEGNVSYDGGGIYGCAGVIRNNAIRGNTAQGRPDEGGSGGGLADCTGPIQNNVITGNHAESGGAIFGCDGTIENNIIANNSASLGGGLHFCHGIIRNNTIRENSARNAGGGLYDCDGTIQNNTVWRNASAVGGGGLFECDGIIRDNTISANSAGLVGGGLMWCDGPIQNNRITANSAHQAGGGLCGCDGPIENNTISRNSAESYGAGGLDDCGGTIENNTITENSAYTYGGGLHRCNGIIQKNTISENAAGWDGGGLADCGGTIQDNTISRNTAGHDGGGLRRCDGAIRNNRISRNIASDYGGGLTGCSGTIEGNLISGNTAGDAGGGLYWCYGTVQNNLISGNSAPEGGGLSGCSGIILNCIIWGNAAAGGSEPSNSALPGYSCIQGWTGGGEGNIADDPKFVDPDGPDDDPKTYDDNNYRLQASSPCIDAGQNQDWMSDAVDLDGNPRIANATVDMGAYEFGSTPRVIMTRDGDVVTLRWPQFGDGRCTVQWTNDLVLEPWQNAPGTWPITDLMWSDIVAAETTQRFYRVESAGIYTNPVGFVKVFPVKDGFTMISVPLVPADSRLNGSSGCIGDVIAASLAGGPTAEEADMLWKWNASTQSYASAYLLDGLGEGYDGKWWDDEADDFSAMTLSAGESFWILRRPRTTESP